MFLTKKRILDYPDNSQTTKKFSTGKKKFSTGKKNSRPVQKFSTGQKILDPREEISQDQNQFSYCGFASRLMEWYLGLLS